MIYKSFLPSPILSEFVRNYTIIHFRFDDCKPAPVKQRSPKVEQKIVFYLTGAVKLVDTQTGVTFTPPPVSVYSHQTERRSLQVTPEFFALIIFFRPGALYKMTRLPMSAFPAKCEDAELIFGPDVRSVRGQLVEANSLPGMISIAEKFLLTRLKSLYATNPIDIVANKLLTDPVSFSLDSMADYACLSTKQFYRKFVERIGITPKFFSMLCRFNHAYQYKLAHPATTWSSIAQEYSYTDYHHLEKEFKSFLGLTPAEWISAELGAPERMLKLR